MASRQAATLDDVRVNPRFWFDSFHETKGLLACVVEILKNAYDWDAQVVRIITAISDQLRHIDDGRGMNQANRRAFLSVGYSTATGGEQSGTFGTGAKKFVFTFAVKVRVVTAPYDEPGFVYVAEFTPMELAEVYSNPMSKKASEFWQRERKTARLWPHAHKFGTDTTYTLRNPKSSSVRRGQALARALSDRLDMVLIESGMVLVDGERLPPKQLEGQIYPLELPADTPLGRIKLVLYRPKHKSADEGLRLTDTAIGEVPFEVFVKLLTPAQREKVPALFLEPDVCGLIVAAWLRDHVTEQRDSYDAHIADDPRVDEFLYLLRTLESEVAERLGITLRQDDDSESAGRVGVEAFIERLQHHFNPDGLVPAGYVPAGGAQPEESGAAGRRQTGRRVRPQPSKSSSLEVNGAEFALGETIEVRLVVPDGVAISGYHFYLDQAHGKVVFKGEGVVRLVANELGRGMIRAINPRTSDVAEAKYEVVTTRVFHLSARGPVGVRAGAHFEVFAVNADMLPSGQLSWQLAGPGDLKVTHQGMAAHLTATRPGRVQIIAFDTARPEVRDVCEVVVMASENAGEVPFVIWGEFFVAEFRQTNLRGWNKPATIVRVRPGQVHRLIFNTMAPGFQEAMRAGSLQTLLACSTALEFSTHFQLDDTAGNGDERRVVVRDWGVVAAEDWEAAMLEMKNEAALLAGEMLGG